MDIFGFDAGKAWDYENGFNLTSDISRMGKIVAHYELYKRIVHLPGHVLELGVFKGASLLRFLTFREILESPQSRKVIGFDAFGSFPQAANEADKRFVERWELGAGAGIPVEELEKSLALKKLGNYELVRGDILRTLPDYLERNPQLKVALLHIDTDIYEPAKAGLELLWDRVVRGGLLVLDDYGTEFGGTKAVDEFLRDRNVLVQKLPQSHASPAFIVKP